MKVIFFRLKGYINILQGMGVDELVIPFDKLNNRIVLIHGENGTGKSTIINTLVPNPDSSDMFRTDVLVDSNGISRIIEYPAEKEIHYLETTPTGQNIYRVLIQSEVDSSMTRRTTKAYISKNGEEFNPTGNVSSFKEIRDSLLDIDSTYLDMSSVTSENRGLVDMIPSERRKHLASYIGGLGIYYDMFRILSKKASNMKSYINTINSKIVELGNEKELYATKSKFETDLKMMNDKRDQFIKDLAEKEAFIKVTDPDNKMQDLYSSISERLGDIKSRINEIERLSGLVYSNNKFLDENAIYTINDIDKYEKLISELIENSNKLIAEYTSSLTSYINKNDFISNSIDEDNARIESLSSDIKTNIESVVKNLESEIEVYYAAIEPYIEILSLCSEDELIDLKEDLKSIDETIKATEDNYSASEFLAGVDLSFTDKNSFSDGIKVLEKSLMKKEFDLEQYKSLAKKYNSEENLRPKECTIDTCPYIKDFVDFENMKVDPVKLEKEISTLKTNILNRKNILEISNIFDSIFRTIQSKKNIISKISDLTILLNINKSKEFFKLKRRIDISSVDTVISLVSIYKDYLAKQVKLSELNNDLAIYLNNTKIINNIKSSIEKKKAELSGNELHIREINISIEKENKILEDSNNKIAALNKLRDILITKENLAKEKQDLKEEYEKVKDKINLVKTAVDEIETLKNAIRLLEENAKPINDSLTKVNFNIARVIEYKNDLVKTSMEYEKISFVRNACSPGNGMSIQSEYVKRYMNDIIIKANDTLSYMFNGTIHIGLPVINEKEFRIPFIGPGGIEVPDISFGSTAQKCVMGLVFSCVSMMNASTKYNIPRFDEIDGGLDPQNRATFIECMNHILDLMRTEQCIICSHNTEFDTCTVSKLYCTHNGIKLE